MSVTEMVNAIMAKYDLDDSERVTVDVMNTLNTLWKLAIIRWISSNPFAYESIKCGEEEIIKATHDLSTDILRFVKNSMIYKSPYFKDVSKSQLMGGLVLDTAPTYLYRENGKILCAVTITKMQSGIIMYIGSNNKNEKISMILKQINRNEDEIKIFLLGFSNYGAKEMKFAEEVGFTYAGKLKKETSEGDLDLLVY